MGASKVTPHRQQQQHGYQIGIISHERHERTLGAELSRCIPIARSWLLSG
jgi:hypothetical protein